MMATIYDLQTGWIVGVIDSPDLTTINLNVGEGQALIEGAYDAATTYISPTGPASLPPRPGDWAAWNGTNWYDPRSIAEMASELDARRDAARMDKADLLLALAQAGLLTPTDAVVAARGEIPPTFQPIVAQWTSAEQLAAQVKWAADAQISRNNPLIIAASEYLNIDPLVLDTIFGIAPIWQEAE